MNAFLLIQILAFPCNQFAGQEPGEHEEIKAFVNGLDSKMTEKIDFFEKGNVNGPQTREVFSFLKRALPTSSGSTEISWNFGA